VYAVATFLIVAVFTTVFVKIATGALIATGLPPEVAGFQARSAFSGAGFTTTEAENVVNHSARRRIISTTMFAGSLGTPTLVVTVLLGLVAPGPGNTTERLLVIIAGLVALLAAIINRPLQRWLVRVGQRYAARRLIPALAGSPMELLNLGDDHLVAEVTIGEIGPDAVRSLAGIEQAIPGSRVLGLRRGDEFIGESPSDFTLHDGDRLVIATRRTEFERLGSPRPE